ncbi:MAG: spermidine/putrescine ABC transporter substrate-binding protein [Cyanophyceae cyanobacterium]
MKKLLVLLMLFLTSMMLPLGCTSNSNNSQGTADDVLNVYNWTTYIDPEAIAQFESEFGVKVNYDTYESNEDLYAKLKPGNPGYDVIFPSDYMVEVMAAEELVEPLNIDNIPNVKNINEQFLNPPYDPENQYSLPYQWGTLGIGYNIEATGGEITSWAEMFNYGKAGSVSLLEDMRETLGAVLIYLGHDPNTTNPDALAEVRDFLVEKKELIQAFAPDTGQLLLTQGEVDMAFEWSGDVFQVMEEDPNIRYVIPEEGTIVWTDTVAIPKDAPHKELAEEFINFILEPEIGAQISNYIKYGSPNEAAKEQGLIAKEDLQNPAIYPAPEVFERLYYIEDVGEATTMYDEAWTEIKVSIGM